MAIFLKKGANPPPGSATVLPSADRIMYRIEPEELYILNW